MGKVIVLVMVLSGCGLYFGDNEPGTVPDAAADATEPDACEPGLPSCASLGCAVGALPVDCPRAEDTSVCYCESTIAESGWCRNE